MYPYIQLNHTNTYANTLCRFIYIYSMQTHKYIVQYIDIARRCEIIMIHHESSQFCLAQLTHLTFSGTGFRTNLSENLWDILLGDQRPLESKAF